MLQKLSSKTDSFDNAPFFLSRPIIKYRVPRSFFFEFIWLNDGPRLQGFHTSVCIRTYIKGDRQCPID